MKNTNIHKKYYIVYIQCFKIIIKLHKKTQKLQKLIQNSQQSEACDNQIYNQKCWYRNESFYLYSSNISKTTWNSLSQRTVRMETHVNQQLWWTSMYKHQTCALHSSVLYLCPYWFLTHLNWNTRAPPIRGHRSKKNVCTEEFCQSGHSQKSCF